MAKISQVKEIKKKMDTTYSFAQTPRTWNDRKHFWHGFIDAKREDNVIDGEDHAWLYNYLRGLKRS